MKLSFARAWMVGIAVMAGVLLTGSSVRAQAAAAPVPIEFTSLKKLTPRQKQHYDLYCQQEMMHANNTYSREKCFGPVYQPVVTFTKFLLPRLQNQVQVLDGQYQEYRKGGQTREANKFLIQKNAYYKLATICEKILECYEKQDLAGIKDAMAGYIVLSNKMKQNGMELPVREWLTEKEATLMLADAIRKKKKEK